MAKFAPKPRPRKEGDLTAEQEKEALKILGKAMEIIYTYERRQMLELHERFLKERKEKPE